jgi:sporulation protein YlmC with PRC-barrel domain
MKRLLASTAIALALGISAPALAQNQTGSPGQSLPEQAQVEKGSESTVIEREHSIPGQPALGNTLTPIEGGGVAAVPSQDITPRELMTTDSQTLGKIAYVVVEGDTGRISYLLTPITEQGNVSDPPERFRVVPWEAVQQDAEGNFRVNIQQDQMGSMPDLSRDELKQLREQAFQENVDRSWESHTTGSDQEQAQAPAQGQGQPQEQQQDSADQTAAVDLPESHPPILLVGPESTEVLGRDGIPTAAVIVDEQGAELANLNHVMVDTAQGVVAYSILSQPGPGQEMAFSASPLSSLRWDDDKGAFVASQSVAESPTHPSAEEAQRATGSEGQPSADSPVQQD